MAEPRRAIETAPGGVDFASDVVRCIVSSVRRGTGGGAAQPSLRADRLDEAARRRSERHDRHGAEPPQGAARGGGARRRQRARARCESPIRCCSCSTWPSTSMASSGVRRGRSGYHEEMPPMPPWSCCARADHRRAAACRHATASGAAGSSSPLDSYRAKRDPQRTPEPVPPAEARASRPRRRAGAAPDLRDPRAPRPLAALGLPPRA